MIHVEQDGPVLVVTIARPEVRNAVDGPTAAELARCFRRFDHTDELSVAVLTGAGGTFCSGADLDTLATGERALEHRPPPADAPLGITRLKLSKPVLAAVEGHAVAGGLELAIWCDLRVVSDTAVFGVFCRRFGVPLVDGGNVRLPRLVGHSHAMDMILTGRPVEAEEARQMGLANRVVPAGTALPAAVELAHELAAFPQACMRSDRQVAIQQWDLDDERWHLREYLAGSTVLSSDEVLEGARRFLAGEGRGGTPVT